MNKCIEDHLTTIILTAVTVAGSLIANCVLYCRMYTINKKEKIKDEPTGIEMVQLESDNQLEDYVMTIGDHRE